MKYKEWKILTQVRKMLCALLASLFLLPAGAEAGIILVLSGGGTRGFAHIGVIEVLEERNIPILGIVGTSIGSLMGALKASGYDAAEMRRIVENLDLPSLMAENTGPMFVFTGDDTRAKRSTVPALSYRKRGEQAGPLGFLSGDKLFHFFMQVMNHVTVTDFSALPIPYAAVATDIRTGEKVVLQSGSLPSAMRASMSIPALFEPWEIEGRLLVDGGLVSNMPIDTAREIFPGIPVVAVDVSDSPTKERSVSSFVDVIDQSLSIVMRYKTEQEAQNADLVLAPRVGEFSFLDSQQAESIIKRGRDAALAKIDTIQALSDSGPDILIAATPLFSNIVGDVCIQGLPEGLALKIRKQYLTWVGKRFDPKEVEKGVQRLMEVDDIDTVDYRLDRTESGDILVVLDVRKSPDLEVGFSGYTTNLHPYRWLYLKGTKRGLLSESDSLSGVVRIGKQWGLDLSYLTAPEPLDSWKVDFAAHKWELDLDGGGRRDWDRYSLGVSRLFRAGDVRMGLGLAYEYIDARGGGSESSVGPTFFATHDTLDIPGDPTEGYAWRVSAWWPDLEEFLYRITYFKPLGSGELWRTYFRLGYAEGDMDSLGHAVYLGAAEELYSMAESPVEAERMIWANVAFRRILQRSVLGIVAAEVFGSYGYAMDRDYGKVASPWEVGVAVNFPNNFIDAKLAAMYGSEGFRLGFFLGVPIWDHYPLP
ncbi:MAG: patatin-like phospholipase family protein [Fretibacterium sp.]|nr:patatin-like phospholipase family protein [Fretibacterium sp.]